MSAGGQGNLFKLHLPDWLVQDAGGEPVREVDLAFTDFAAIAFALAAAGGDFAAHHTVFTLNNLIGDLPMTYL